MMFRLAHPALLALLIIILAWLAWRLTRKPVGITHSMTSILAELSGGSQRLVGHIPLILRTACFVLLVLAAARPQLYNVSRDINSSGVDIMVCLDTSGSMQALDFTIDNEPVSRLAAVKKVVMDFIEKRDMDRIGLVVFGTQAFTQAPLTLDKGLLMDLVKRMEIGMAGNQTAIGEAIAVGGKRLKDLEAESKILILLTDGRQTTEGLTPTDAAEALQALGIKIYTIGVGGTEPAPFPVQTLFGTKIIRQKVDLDEKTLMKVADIGTGQYFRAADTDRLQEIYAIIDAQEKTEIKVKEFFHFKELYRFFLIPALLLLIADIIMRTTLLRTIP
jgi:Ca-activated chloride channel family protein